MITVEEQLIYDFLSSDAFWTVNKSLAKTIGVEPALLLADFISKQRYFKKRDLVDEEGFWFNSQKQIEIDTTLSQHRQNKALKILKKHNIVRTKLRGVPATTHYIVDSVQLLNFLATRCEKIQQLDTKNFSTNKNNNKNKDIYKSKKKQKFILERKEEFRQLCKQHISASKGYSELMMKDFFEYWTEHGDGDKKMRFEKERTFGITRRLATWKRNESAFKPKPNVNKL